MKSKEELKRFFENGDIPKQEEFWEWQESYWHKEEKLPADKIDYDFSEKADLVDGKVPASQLPSYVDDILEFDSVESLPNPGEKGKIYLITDGNLQFRWSGSDYISISSAEDLMTLNTSQEVTSTKRFFNTGNSVNDLNLQVWGKNGAKAGVFFYSEGMDTAQINFDGYFNFKNQNDEGYRNIKSAGFIKDGYNNGFILLAGGGHIPITEFVANSDFDNQLALVHKADITGGIYNGSIGRTNKSWFDYNWANTGTAGSVINFSGLNGAYSTELFSDYQTGTVIGMRTRNGDAGVWNNPTFLWHNKNFNPTSLVPYTGANQNVDLNSKNLGNINNLYTNNLKTNGIIKHNGLGLSIVNASSGGGASSILVKTGFVTGNMGTFTVKMYHYAHEYFEFNVSNYKYNNSNHTPTITWKAGNSKRIERIEFLKDSADNLYINIVCYLAYARVAITDFMAYGWDETAFDNSNWSIEFNGSTTNLTNEGQTVSSNFLRDDGLGDFLWKIYDNGSFKGLLSDKPFSFLTNGGGTAQKIQTGGLLTSDAYSDTAYIPTNGIYSKGGITTSGALTINKNSQHINLFEADGGKWHIESVGGVFQIVETDVAARIKIQPGASTFSYNNYGVYHTGNFNPATKVDAGDNVTKALGFTGGDINAAPWIYTSTGEFRYLATQSWVSSQDYTTPSFVEESIAELTVELTNPGYHIRSKNKFVTIIITDDFSNEKVIWEEFFPEQSINVINTGGSTIDLDLQGTTFDRIVERETIEYYVNKDRKLIKKGNYRETTILIQ